MIHHPSHEPIELPREVSDALAVARSHVERQLRRVAPHIDVGDLAPDLPLRDEADLDAAGLASLRAGLADVTAMELSSETFGDEASLLDVVDALAHRLVVDRWQITLAFSTTEQFETHATATLSAGLDEICAEGVAHKNPADPNASDVGHEVAAARALSALADQLLDVATTRITEWDDDAAPLRA